MIEKLKDLIVKANIAYREGSPIMSDSEYDILLEELSIMSPDDDLINKVGLPPKDESRKARLPIEMASMGKIKSLDALKNWIRLKEIPINSEVVITPKYDGISLCVNEITNQAFTRGDGTYGQKSNDHYQSISNKLTDQNLFHFTYGEVMIPKSTFITKYSTEFANPRNLVAGLLNAKEISPILNDCKYIKYGGIVVDKFKDKVKTKGELLSQLNSCQTIEVPFRIEPIANLSEELFIELFKEWSKEYEIDGLIIEVNDLNLQNDLGRETSSNNPVWARAYKHPSFEQSATTDVIGISWNISKQGYLKPILHINPVKLDGVTVSNVTGNNARFVKDMGLGIGAKVVVKRSGMVIPIIADVIQGVEFTMPNVPNIDWNENGIELVTLNETDDQKLKKIIAFFDILESDNVSEGVITQLWKSGHRSIKDILNLKIEDLQKIERFGKRKSEIVYNSIQKSINNISLSKLQHATGIFNGLGSKKLILLEHFQTKPSIEEVMQIEGFAEISAKIYVDNWDRFFEFVKDIPVKIEKKIESIKVSDDLDGKQFVFTGVRRKDLEEIIESKGGKIGSSVSKNTTYLVMKEKGSGSSKENKAINLGVEILTVDDLINLLK
jgi:NAD-dependent DNA ligase